MIRPSVTEEYERLAGKMFMSRSQLMGNALELGLSDMHALEALGVVRALGGVRKAQEHLREWRERQDAILQRA
jgi:hypothetical protein